MLEQKLAGLNLALPELAIGAASFVGYKRTGNLVFISGQLPLKNGKPTLVGRLGDGVSIDEAYAAAQQCTLNVLAQLKLAVNGDWSRVVQFVRVGGFVRCTPDFADSPKVVNGASDLLIRYLGPSGSMRARPSALARCPPTCRSKSKPS